MSDAQKLTKKQRKGLAFRQRGKGKTAEHETPGGDVPIAENLDDDGPAHHANTNDQPARSSSIVEKQKAEDQGKANVSAKRKRSDDAAQAPSPKKQKKGTSKKQQQQQQRYILFVGNLKYTTSKEAISKHFAACDPPPVVRLLTPKSATPTKSKGCAFLEFTHRNALQQALKLHQSEIEGRKINVELTAGGGGKSDKRLEKLKSRNRDLASQRTKRAEKEKESGDVAERPQRHSTTSGLEQTLPKMRTWSVPEEGDDGQTHRGGKKHAKGDKQRGRRPKPQGTGVNAIPVG
ncbi:hypothetical protein SCHPADRAFT_897983 [Schizopora paradoxa]|uniref:RRM domain-containing protein n=1 Tax=Schizopora paradoxa TaxID=27342 RepID=A0A0H2SA37_9AGAM|nr:hypothetical protein SCHPADRAFT_897983 [Schizopora paradoxa]